MKKKFTGLKMASLLLLSSFLLNHNVVFSQGYPIKWQKSLGGSNDDYAYAIAGTSDGFIYYAGFTMSNDYCVWQNQGGYDGWIVKMTSGGDTVWAKPLGGSGDDFLYGLTPTNDGGVIAAGFTSSSDGAIHHNYGSYDYWLIRLSSQGDTLWSKTYGGSSMDAATAIVQTYPPYQLHLRLAGFYL